MKQTIEQLVSGELNGIQRLKLSCGLNSFPKEIFALADTLEILDLSGNELFQLPDEIVNLKKLKVFFLSDNLFTEFPKVLSKLHSLDMIGFKANRISIIEEDALPVNVRWLILTNNDLSQLPKSLGNCLRLQKLMLAGNKLKSLPIELAACKNLELLRISANNFDEFPPWLFELPKLAWVALGGNPCSLLLEKDLPLLEIPWENIKINSQIGEGASGVIYEGELLNEDKRNIAVKIFRGELTSDGLPDDEMNAAISISPHQNLVKVYGKISKHPENKKGLVLELIPLTYKNLGNPPSFETCTRDTFSEGLKFSIYKILNIVERIASAVAHIHSFGFTHGDLYAHNILMEEETSNVIFGDFGAAAYYIRNLKLATSIEKIEMRAFGCLLEDLLDRVDEVDSEMLVLNELRILKENCMQEKVLNRPNFLEIQVILENFAKRIFFQE